ncbi:MAG: hypothetical protein MUE32_07000, partial [Bacteroidales bacterium]|nr:hypothetical protein [Bacteroidales bacterium]
MVNSSCLMGLLFHCRKPGITAFCRNGGKLSLAMRKGIFSLLLLAVSAIGYSQTNYYSKSSGNLNDLATWGTNTNGSGSSPADFTTANQVFNIRNNANPTISANWTVSGLNSLIIIGDGTNPCAFTVSGTLVLTGSTQISANGVLNITSTAGTPFSGSLTVNNDGTYLHARDGGAIPTATWNPTS